MSRSNRNRRNDGNKGGVRINPDAKAFANATFKKYRKENDYYDSEKEAKKGYYMYLMDLLPDTITFVIKYGHIKDEKIQETKNAVYANLINKGFIKALRKDIKKGNKIKNIKLLPIIIKEILVETKKANDQILANDPNASLYDVSDVVELSQAIIAKKLKKMEKAGIPLSLAFDVLSIIPCDDAMELCSQFHRIRFFYDCLYEHAKTTAIPYEKIMDLVVSDEYRSLFITYELLERKERFGRLTDPQKKLYVDISNWCFNTMNSSSKSEIEAIINAYTSARRRDDEAGKDGNRRYAFTQLSQDEYPKIVKVVNAMIANNDSIKKYVS